MKKHLSDLFYCSTTLHDYVRMRRWLVLQIWSASLMMTWMTIQAADTHPFHEAQTAYAEGKWAHAADKFQQCVNQQPSSGGFFNLGNSLWKLENTGDAVLAWERSLWLNPYNSAARTNLSFARASAQLPSPQLVWYEICSTWLPTNVWPWITVISFWLTLCLVILPGIWGWRNADWRQATAALCLAVFLLSLPALFGLHTRSKMGVIRVKDTPLRMTPTSEAQTIGRLDAGDLARVERVRGGYLLIRLGNDSTGWIEKNALGWIARK